MLSPSGEKDFFEWQTGRGSIFGNERSLKRQNRRSWGRVSNGAGSGNRNSAGNFEPSEEDQRVNDFYAQSPEKVSPEKPDFDHIKSRAETFAQDHMNNNAAFRAAKSIMEIL